MKRFRRGLELAAGLSALCLLGCSSASSSDKLPPTQVTLAVRGLDGPEKQAALEKELRKQNAVEECKVEPGRVTVTVTRGWALRLSTLTAATQGVSGVEIDAATLPLIGSCELTLAEPVGTHPEAILKVLQAGPNVERAVHEGERYKLVIRGGTGWTVGEMTAALKAWLGDKADAGPPAVTEIAWRAAPPPESAASGSPAGSGGYGGGGYGR
ncbi:MAG: hypothetical protein HYZ53_07775 [Planctomycetes bacterium]|nr:hypothetical protein [Planctomycetota bacterium]